MFGCAQHRGGRSRFDQLPGIQDRNIVTNLSSKRQIMQHKNRARSTGADLLQNQLHDLRLNRDIQRAGRLIRDQELRFTSQGDRNHDALLHTA